MTKSTAALTTLVFGLFILGCRQNKNHAEESPAVPISGQHAEPNGNLPRDYKKILVVSGGGARGAWGVGVAENLVKYKGRYMAVFGTSTGSLMAPFILLNEIPKLEKMYTNVNQDSIFDVSPFNIDSDTYDRSGQVIIKTSLNYGNAIFRLLSGRRDDYIKTGTTIKIGGLNIRLTKRELDAIWDYFFAYIQKTQTEKCISNSHSNPNNKGVTKDFKNSIDDYLSKSLPQPGCGPYYTLGESNHLRELIKSTFTPQDFDELKELYKKNGLYFAVAVTNMNKGNVEIKSSADLMSNPVESTDYNSLINWIWASANEPVWMSYFNFKGNDYADGGVRDLIPIDTAIKYAISHNIDTVDIILNQSKDYPQDTTWSSTSGNFLDGVIRIIDLENAGTLSNNLRTSALLDSLNNLQIRCQGIKHHPVYVHLYSMPDTLAATQRDELGFNRHKMIQFYEAGKAYAAQTKTSKNNKSGEIFRVY